VRPPGIVVGHVAAEHVFEVAAAQDQQPVETLGAVGPYEPLRIGIHVRCTHWRVDHLGAFAAEHLVEGGPEFAVAVVDQEPRRLEEAPESRIVTA
jgi:hypothetical protein